MSWDEAAFSWAFELGRRWVGTPSAAVQTRRVDLREHAPRFKSLARLLTSSPVELTFVEGGGGWSGEVLTLPVHADQAATPEQNLAEGLLQLAWLCASRAAGFTLPRASSPSATLFATALAASRTREELLTSCPGIRELLVRTEARCRASRGSAKRTSTVEAVVRLALGASRAELSGSFDPLILTAAEAHLRQPPTTALELQACSLLEERGVFPPVSFWGSLQPAAARLKPRLHAVPDEEEALPTGTTLKKKQVAKVERVDEPDNQLAENPLVHSFEKVHTLEEYKGGSKRIDGDDELAAHAKALDELDLKQLIRSHQRAKSLYQADLAGLVSTADEAEAGSTDAGLRYDEWDEAHHKWKKAWCRLTTHPVSIAPDADAIAADIRARMARTTTGLRAVFEQLEASRAWRARQLDGPDVDLDAVISRAASLRAGHEGPERLYLARRRHSRDTAVLVLLDTSLSTDAWVANRRVIDVEKESMIALGDALDGLFDEVAVAGFCSQTRHDCRVLLAKGFEDDWAEGAKRVASLEPRGFTRIGPALRHGTALLQKCGARRKLLLLISDGKPSDLDQYEGRYGLADVHRAVLDAEAASVTCHAIAVDPASRAWLPSLFGHGRASVVSSPGQLIDAMAKVTSEALR